MGQEGTIKNLIDNKKCDVNERDEHGTRPVHIAASQNETGILKLLVGNGARVDVIDDFNQTPLLLAIKNSHDEAARFIEKTLASQVINAGDSITSIQGSTQGARI